METVEDIVYRFGLTTPTMRFIAGFTVTESLILYLKPSYAFESNGDAREWMFTSHSPSAALIPWWFPGLVVGSVLGLFI